MVTKRVWFLVLFLKIRIFCVKMPSAETQPINFTDCGSQRFASCWCFAQKWRVCLCDLFTIGTITSDRCLAILYLPRFVRAFRTHTRSRTHTHSSLADVSVRRKRKSLD